MADWHPAMLAEPHEWVLKHPASPAPWAVIRMFRFRSPSNAVDLWYRVVTWSESSEDRELIGWCPTLAAAAEAAWDYQRAASAWQHNLAAHRVHDDYANVPQKPAAYEMLLAYRAALEVRQETIDIGGRASV